MYNSLEFNRIKKISVIFSFFLALLILGCNRGPIKEVKVQPEDAVMQVGQTKEMKAVGIYESGEKLDNLKPKWEINPQELGTISNEGVLKAEKAGKITVTATYNNIVGKAKVAIREESSAKKSQKATQEEITDYDKPIRIGWTAWSDAEAVTKMVKRILEEKMGYEVNLVMSSIGIQYQGLKNGEIDAMLMSWLPITHQNYWKDAAGKVVNLGPIYTRAKLGWVVPDYVPEDMLANLEDLKKPEVAKKLEKKITGIDPGSGLMQASEKAMEAYGLKEFGYQLIPSSGAGMTSALSRSIERNEFIVVTGWNPHWKFSKWDLRYLDDPKGALGGRERIHCLVRKGFYQDVPVEVFDFFTRLFIPLDQLEDMMLKAMNSSYEKAVSDYIDNHPQRVHYWVTGEVGQEQ